MKQAILLALTLLAARVCLAQTMMTAELAPSADTTLFELEPDSNFGLATTLRADFT